MKTPHRLHAARLALVLLAGLLGAGAARADDAVYTGADFAKADGQAVYTHICQACHMDDGRGAKQVGYYPSFAGDRALVSAQYVALTVLYGRRNMPAFGLSAADANTMRSISLSDEQVAGVVNYVRSHFGNAFPDRITPAEVAALRH
ncbi:c-type cytochrome [Frateuria defendens]|uniref:c-type cytochrome n=1 Tax=Frateuria defendens TaxID=2219559 RepID=UPI00066FE832|nr:cytochrome c [Frateuria defendens]